MVRCLRYLGIGHMKPSPSAVYRPPRWEVKRPDPVHDPEAPMIENHAAMKWERLANEYLKERDECLALATKNRETADRYRDALNQLHGMIQIPAADWALIAVINKALNP